MQRPKRKENEDDLLKFQQQFLQQGIQPSAKVQRVARDSVVAGERDVVSLTERVPTSEEKDHSANKSRFKRRREEISKNFPKKEKSSAEVLEEHDQHITTMLSKIQERQSVNPGIMQQNRFHGGFPAVPHLGRDVVSSQTTEADQSHAGHFEEIRSHYSPLSTIFIQNEEGEKKKSLFAKQFQSKNPSAFGLEKQADISFRQHCTDLNEEHTDHLKNCDEFHMNKKDVELSPSISSRLVTGKGLCGARPSAEEKDEIHKENLRKLSEMTKPEIIEEKLKLETSLDPKLLAFIKSRKVSRKENCSKSEDNFVTVPPVSNDPKDSGKQAADDEFDPHREFQIDKSLPGMDVIEDEKLQWIKDPPKPFHKEASTGTVARFDLEGKLIPKDADVPANLGLHHHGEDPSLPGYSLEELFHLARSNFLQQRIFALKLLAKILEQYHEGSFDGKLQQCLMEQLLDAGLPFLLRWALDDATEAVYCAAIYGFSAMLNITVDNVALNELLYAEKGYQLPCLRPLTASVKTRRIRKEENRELTDPEVISIDLIRGLLKIQLLPRLRYILEVCEPDSITVNNCMLILCRVAVHSAESSYQILKCPRLMQTIVNKVLPITWTNSLKDSGTGPCLNALRLIRLLCVAGKYLSSKLWHDFDISSRIIRYAASAEEENDEIAKNVDFAVESVHIWRICLLYGVASSTTIDLYPLLINLLQKYLTNNDERFKNLKSSLVLLAESMVEMTSYRLANRKETEHAEKKVHFNEDIEEDAPVNLEWNMIAGVHSILSQCVRTEGKAFISKEIKNIDLRYVSCLFMYLSAYTHNASKQISVNKVDLLTEIEAWMNEFLADIIGSSNLEELMRDLSDRSGFALPVDNFQRNHEIDSFPSYGMKLLRRSCRCLDSNSPIMFISSLARLLCCVGCINKRCCNQMVPLLKAENVIRYLEKVNAHSSSCQKLCSSSVSSVVERSFIYNFLSMFQITSNVIGVEQFGASEILIYHVAAFKFLTTVQSNEIGQALHIMTEIIFPCNLYTKPELYNLTETMKQMEISTSTSEISKNLQFLLSNAESKLPVICNTFIANCFHGYEKDVEQKRLITSDNPVKKESFLLSENRGSLLPADWFFLPILNLYNLAMNVELEGKVISQLNSDAVKTLEMNLSFVLMLEVYRPEALSSIPDAIKLVRILCVFLIGNDAFLESPVYHLLQALATIYMREERMEKLDFEIKFPGIASFYDLFLSLLVQYSASSFGDPLFGNYLLIPLQQKHNVKYRKALWGENCDILRIFSMPIKLVMLNLGKFLNPVEEDAELLDIYLKSITTGRVRPSWCPLFYLVAVHHLSSFIFNTKETLDFSKMELSKPRLLLLDKLVSIKNEEIKFDVLLYHRIDVGSVKGFKTHEKLPAYRQLIIENRNKGFS